MEHTKDSYKIVIIGEGRVGKTSILLRYTQNQFNQKQASTTNVNSVTQMVNIQGQPIKLSIWDTAGQDRFQALTPMFYREADGAILVYDITLKNSFERLQLWLKELLTVCPSDIKIMIVGNKCDKQFGIEVPEEEAESFARKYGIQHKYTSALKGTGVMELFSVLAQKIYTANPPKSLNQSKGQFLQINQQKQKRNVKHQNSNCC